MSNYLFPFLRFFNSSFNKSITEKALSNKLNDSLDKRNSYIDLCLN